MDEIVFYLAPKLFGDQGQGIFAGLRDMTEIAQATAVRIVDARAFGEDLRITARLGG